MTHEYLVYEDDSEIWFRDILTNHVEEARERAFAALENSRQDENGCRVTDTEAIRKIRFRGRQLPAYRFIYCILNSEIVSSQEVVRHRCHNRQCINPEHLQLGTQADNKQDDWDYAANGIDWSLL